jgi:NTP pyrophosphatase (non-canonical NTP hydrolase)
MNAQDYLEWAVTKDRKPEQYQELANRLLNNLPQSQLLHGALGIAGEAGELADAIKKAVLYNKPLDVENVKEEAGDLCWYLSIILNAVGSSFGEVMSMNHTKLEKRYPGGFTEKLAQERRDKVYVIDENDITQHILKSK